MSGFGGKAVIRVGLMLYCQDRLPSYNQYRTRAEYVIEHPMAPRIISIIRTIAGTCLLLSGSASLADRNHTFTLVHICKATISVLMNRDVRIMQVDELMTSFMRLSYRDPEYGKLYKFKCHIALKTIEQRGSDGEVIWGNADGRWRVDPLDSTINYSVADRVLTIVEVYGDGSFKKEQFTLKDFEKADVQNARKLFF